MFINVGEKNNLNNIKISNDINNSSYTLGLYGIVYQGVPEILYTNIIYIEDTKQIWTHGVLYNCQSNIESKIADLENNNISDREIKDIIDSLTGEKIYVKGHADATYTNDGNTVSSVLNKLYDLVGSHNKCIQLFCIEPVTVTINGVDTICNAGEQSTVFVGDTEFTITPTSNKSIKTISGYPIPLTWYEWLEGVDVFQNIVFDMNSPDMYNHWGQGYQGQYHVQEAQYINCIFWSDNPYTQDISNRTNYTLYNSTQLPLCYSSIRENTYKPFYFAYGVTLDPNWTNEDYIYSFSLTTVATQPWSYYGLRTIGVFNSAINPITLPKDCRGLMFYSPVIESVGVLDAINTTNFGAKSGSWRDAFGTCYSLKNLYIKNLKASINVSWSPINVDSITYIVNNAANTSKIYIYVSPYTYNILPDSLIQSAISKNIEISLIETNYNDDKRLKMLKMTGDGNSYLANDGTYKTIEIPEVPSLDGYAKLEDIPTVPTKVSAFENDSNYVSLETVQQMIADNNVYCTNDDILRLFDSSIPETPVDPEVPVDSIGSITEDNSIVIDETQLENGTYTLRYVDSNDNIIDNFNEITSFKINK